ncbi:fumarylacetoacetate hydrolase family protein [Streptomyces sp. NPDC001315]|uniref:fumarylacetoacetate hydrolase family protein n=1 Tax=Streptomyces sp. NPDC001315 TaxID=3364562 RepID=UPI0036763EF6
MKLGTVRLGRGRTAAARLQKQHCVLLPHSDVGALIASGTDWQERAAADTGERCRLTEVSHTSLILRPANVVRVEPNYAGRLRETGGPSPAVPGFSVLHSCRPVGAHDEIRLPATGDDLDWGAQLGVVVGRRAHAVAAEKALGHVAGYTVINAVAVRDGRDRALTSGVDDRPDAGIAVGPTMVTTDDTPMAGRGLAVSCLVDGWVRRKGNTSDLLFDVATIIAHVSSAVTLLPGDLIATGIPGPTGTGRGPRVTLETGQELVATVKGVGELRNMIV